MARSKNERWNKKVTEWFPLGYSRKKGAPAVKRVSLLLLLIIIIIIIIIRITIN